MQRKRWTEEDMKRKSKGGQCEQSDKMTALAARLSIMIKSLRQSDVRRSTEGKDTVLFVSRLLQLTLPGKQDFNHAHRSVRNDFVCFLLLRLLRPSSHLWVGGSCHHVV